MRFDAPPIPWFGSAYRQIPAHGDILDFQHAGVYARNRWNPPDHRTLYLAGDRGVLAAEWARHLPYPWSDGITHTSLSRQVFRLAIRLDRVLDVNSPAVLQQFGVISTFDWITDTAPTKRIAQVVREETTAQAMIVLSIAFIDDHTRWNLVVFLDKVPEDTSAWIVSAESIGLLQWSDS